MDARKAVEKAAAAVEAAEAEVTRTRDERDAALCDAAASGAPKARIARAAEMSRAQVVGIIEKGAGRARGGDVLARVAPGTGAGPLGAAPARAARSARHEAVTARDALLVQVANAKQLTAAEAARIAGVPPSTISNARAHQRTAAESAG